jgi:hypothetical protein
MTAPVVRLEAAGLDPLELDPYQGYVVTALDLGYPTVRTVVQDAPDADGTIDTTSFVGARYVNANITLNPVAATKEQMRARLRAFMSPKLRPTMFVALDGEAEKQLTLRASLWSNLIQNPAYATVAAQWAAPYGILESADQHSATVLATGQGVEGGRVYDLEYDRTYIGGTVIGETIISNAGDADAYPLIRMYGPATDPTLRNVTQDRALVFTGLTIGAGEFVELDTRAKTIRYQGDPTDSRYSTLDFPASSWWTLSPGLNTIRFLPATYTAPAQAELVWRDAWI